MFHLPEGREAEMVNEAMTSAFTTLPDELVWDQERELSSHAAFTVETGGQPPLRSPLPMAARIE